MLQGIDVDGLRRVASRGGALGVPPIDLVEQVMPTGKFAIALVVGTLVLGGPVAAEDDFPAHFSCDFNQGYSWSYSAGRFQPSPPADLSFEIGKIDLDRQTASLILEGKPANGLKIVRAINANHFIEVVNEGFLNLTTIYDRDPETGKYPAVHSRHFGLLGQPVFAQYAGTCVPKP